MTDDIVTRLRQKYAGQLPICTEAADIIEQLRAKLIDAYDDIGKCHAAIDQLRKDNPT